MFYFKTKKKEKSEQHLNEIAPHKTFETLFLKKKSLS